MFCDAVVCNRNGRGFYHRRAARWPLPIVLKFRKYLGILICRKGLLYLKMLAFYYQFFKCCSSTWNLNFASISHYKTAGILLGSTEDGRVTGARKTKSHPKLKKSQFTIEILQFRVHYVYHFACPFSYKSIMRNFGVLCLKKTSLSQVLCPYNGCGAPVTKFQWVRTHPSHPL